MMLAVARRAADKCSRSRFFSSYQQKKEKKKVELDLLLFICLMNAPRQHSSTIYKKLTK